MRRRNVIVVTLFLIGLSVAVWFIVSQESNEYTPRIEVEEKEVHSVIASTTKKVFSCGVTEPEEYRCYETYYTTLVGAEGIEAGFTDLKSRYESSAVVKSNCHQLTHVIGRVGSSRSGGVGEAFAHGDPFCWSGFYHGVMEEVIQKIGESNLKEKINIVCATIPGKDSYSFLYFNCVHGLGHGLMQVYANDLFQSLDMCAQLEGKWERDSCAGGVFMENVMIESRGDTSRYLQIDNPLFPCDAVSSEFKTSCYLMQTSHMLTIFNSDFGKVFAACDTVEEGYKEICFQSAGRDASGRSSSNGELTKATCMQGESTLARQNCVIGAVKDFISYYHGDDEAKKFCGMLEPELQDTCLTTATSYYKNF